MPYYPGGKWDKQSPFYYENMETLGREILWSFQVQVLSLMVSEGIHLQQLEWLHMVAQHHWEHLMSLPLLIVGMWALQLQEAVEKQGGTHIKHDCSRASLNSSNHGRLHCDSQQFTNTVIIQYAMLHVSIDVRCTQHCFSIILATYMYNQHQLSTF